MSPEQFLTSQWVCFWKWIDLYIHSTPMGAQSIVTFLPWIPRISAQGVVRLLDRAWSICTCTSATSDITKLLLGMMSWLLCSYPQFSGLSRTVDVTISKTLALFYTCNIHRMLLLSKSNPLDATHRLNQALQTKLLLLLSYCWITEINKGY